MLEAEAAQTVRARAVRAAAAAEETSARLLTARAEALAATAAAVTAREAAQIAAQRHHTHQREAARLCVELAQESARASQHREAQARQAALKAYRAVLRPAGGIGDRLLDRGRAALNRQINQALRELGARYEAEIGPDYSVAIRGASPGADWLPASLGSGYQKFVLSLAARLAIWRLSTSSRPDAFIVDEGFGACDEDYLEAMAVALEALASAPGGPRLVFVVSHVDALKTRLERALEIEALPGGSRVANGVGRAAAAAPTRAAAGAVAVAATEAGPAATLGPDPETAGKVYCETCRQSLRASWAAKHLASAKHAAAVEKAEGKRR